MGNENGLRLTVSTMGDTQVNSSAPREEDSNDPNKLVFYIPKDTAGGVIGKGAANIKAIMEEFSVNIYVDRDEYQSMRKVVIRSENPAANQGAKEKVLMMSELTIAQVAATASAAATATTTAFGAPEGDGAAAVTTEDTSTML